MITEFEDFCLWTYVIVDELWRHLPPAYKPSRGPEPGCSDSELITMALVGECRGWTKETELVAHWQERRHLFPVVPERSRFNRRRRALMHAINAIRQGVLAVLDLAQDRPGLMRSAVVGAGARRRRPRGAGYASAAARRSSGSPPSAGG